MAQNLGRPTLQNIKTKLTASDNLLLDMCAWRKFSEMQPGLQIQGVTSSEQKFPGGKRLWLDEHVQTVFLVLIPQAA